MPISNDNTNVFQKGACCAAGVYVAKKLPKVVSKFSPISKYAINSFEQIPNVSKKQTDQFIQSMLNNPVLKNSTFKTVAVTSKNAEELANTFTDTFVKLLKDIFETKKNKETFLKFAEKKIKPKFSEIFDVVKKGQNAFYQPFFNTAYYPKNKPFFLAHEIGHAINANTGKFCSYLIDATRIAPALMVFTLPAVAIWKSFNNKKTEDKSFVQKHAGKIVAASFLPMIAEEGLASSRAINAAKTANLSKETIKALTKAYGMALNTYIATGIFASLSVALAVKLFSKKDNAKNIS